MAFDLLLSERISQYLINRTIEFEEKKMFGGLAFLIEGKMVIGVIQDKLMAKVGPQAKQKIQQFEYATPMDFTGKVMKQYVFILPEGLEQEEHLRYWIELAINFRYQE